MTFCCLCECEFEGYGNNPEPLCEAKFGRCCNDCNAKVITKRLEELYNDK